MQPGTEDLDAAEQLCGMPLGRGHPQRGDGGDRGSQVPPHVRDDIVEAAATARQRAGDGIHAPAIQVSLQVSQVVEHLSGDREVVQETGGR
jgi:hypothetical protein